MNASELFAKIRHYRTTLAGIMMIVGSLATFVAGWITSGLPSAEKWSLLGAGLTAGAGFIASADAKTVTKQIEATKDEL